ncbi:hypothetical protein CEXT_727421 [Caerostris extrusa]|uniref:Uncharacterized protein n=1 Tax=Caerostris extrusa TaxID=172846 RepID=A0AAV4U3L0_CAEEX|nr:hypothetical protein CEXT_727421 [Caerostris extrusa]
MTSHQRRLQQLAIQKQNFPLTSKVALKDFYDDDLISGANSATEALDLQEHFIRMLSSAGLVLRKWASNCNELTNLIQEDLRLSNASLRIDDDTVKTLGSCGIQPQMSSSKSIHCLLKAP